MEGHDWGDMLLGDFGEWGEGGRRYESGVEWSGMEGGGEKVRNKSEQEIGLKWLPLVGYIHA